MAAGREGDVGIKVAQVKPEDGVVLITIGDKACGKKEDVEYFAWFVDELRRLGHEVLIVPSGVSIKVLKKQACQEQST